MKRLVEILISYYEVKSKEPMAGDGARYMARITKLILEHYLRYLQGGKKLTKEQP